jgi:hypothetical protein
MPVDFDSLGTYLRQERERQQVSLHEGRVHQERR